MPGNNVLVQIQRNTYAEEEEEPMNKKKIKNTLLWYMNLFENNLKPQQIVSAGYNYALNSIRERLKFKDHPEEWNAILEA